MKLAEAIVIGKVYTVSGDEAVHPDFLEAVKLLVEAGKLEIKNRGTLRPGLYPLLPGETEE